VSNTFDRLCDAAAREAKRQPVSEEILRARRLLADDVTLERAWIEINAARERERVGRSKQGGDRG
jgi:hypothetical protein